MITEERRAYNRAYYRANRARWSDAERTRDRVKKRLQMAAWDARPGNRERRLAAQRNRRLQNRAVIDAAMAGGCVDCGTTERVVLDLDHVRGTKVASVGAMLGSSLEKLRVEIAKCETRCANCHRRVTAQRRQERRAA